MVGNDQVHAEASRGVCGGKGANAGIDADDQLYSCRCSTFNHIAAQVVAFFDPVRDVEVGSAAAQLDCSLEDDDGSGAVHVIITVDEDAFFAFDGGVDAVNSSLHARHEVGRVKMGERGIQETLCRLRISDSANGQQMCE